MNYSPFSSNFSDTLHSTQYFRTTRMENSTSSSQSQATTTSISQITNSADSSSSSIISPQLPFTFSSNSEYHSYGRYKIPRPHNTITSGHSIIFQCVFVIEKVNGSYVVKCRLCGENAKGTKMRIATHFIGPNRGSNNWKMCSEKGSPEFEEIKHLFLKELGNRSSYQGNSNSKRSHDTTLSLGQSNKRQASIQQHFASMSSSNFKNEQLVDHGLVCIIIG